ncbi:MAG: hypothetical protein HN576_10140 [Bacteriovoracaceae bacterium]|jgi:hypothetical protein|nr:hypothetical protein [Bacteriovoracaceae bacterium]
MMLRLKKTMVLTSITFLVIGQVFPIYAQGFGARILPSLEWQKQELASKINSKIKSSIIPIIKNNEYLIDVDIEASEPIKPEFNKTDEEAALERAEKEEKEKEEEGLTPEEIAEQKKEKEKEKSIREKELKNKNKVRLSDIDPRSIPEDSILFSKLGLEAPLIDDFNDFQPDGKIILTYGDATTRAKEKLSAEKSKQSKLKAKLDALKSKPKPSAVEQIWKYNKSIDIFQNLKSVKVKVQLSKELVTSTRDTISEVLNSLTFNLGKIKPELTIEYVDMTENFSKGISSSKLTVILSWLSKFSTALGLVIAALLMGGLAWILFNRYEKLQEMERGAAAAVSAGENAGDDEEDEADDSSLMSAMDNSELSEQGLNGIERFKTFLLKNNVDAALLVKKWIKLGDKNEINALRALVQQLENTELAKVFSVLSQEERSSWKSYLDRTIDSEGLRRANLFISNQIVEEIIVPSAITDPEALDLLLRIRPENAAIFVQENPEEGKILMNVMNTKFIAKIIDHIDTNKVDGIINSSLKFSENNIEGLLDSFKSKLKNYQSVATRTPFLERVIELIPMAAPSRENALYKALGRSGEQESLYNLAMENFPAVLIAELPTFFLKDLLQRYPMEKKVEMLLSVDEQVREHFVSIYAPAGSKANDMLELEFQKAENDLVFQKNIRANGEEMWKSFVNYSRKTIRLNKAIKRDIDGILTEWSEKICKGETPEQAAKNLSMNSDIAA